MRSIRRVSFFLVTASILLVGCQPTGSEPDDSSPAPVSLTDREIAAIVSSAYCLGQAGDTNNANREIVAVPRDFTPAATCEAACNEWAKKSQRTGTGVPLEIDHHRRGVGDIGCTVLRENGKIAQVAGRPSSYFQSDDAKCDWCCCMVK